MSDNSQLLIQKFGEGYIISHIDVEEGGGFFVGQPHETLEQAVEAANKYQLENEVEYGLKIDV